MILVFFACVFFFKQKTAYEMRISDWSSDVCSSDLPDGGLSGGDRVLVRHPCRCGGDKSVRRKVGDAVAGCIPAEQLQRDRGRQLRRYSDRIGSQLHRTADLLGLLLQHHDRRSEEHTSELQSLMRNSYAVLCLKTKKYTKHHTATTLK